MYTEVYMPVNVNLYFFVGCRNWLISDQASCLSINDCTSSRAVEWIMMVICVGFPAVLHHFCSSSSLATTKLHIEIQIWWGWLYYTLTHFLIILSYVEDSISLKVGLSACCCMHEYHTILELTIPMDNGIELAPWFLVVFCYTTSLARIDFR